MKCDGYSAFDYSHIGLHIDRVYKMNQKLQKSQFTSQTSEETQVKVIGWFALLFS